MDDDARWYFAYGSNMQSATLRVRRAIEPSKVLVGCLPEYRLVFGLPIGPGLRGVANIVPCPNSEVWGVLFRITGEQHEHLERTEGVASGLYRRHQVQVEVSKEPIVAETLVSDRHDDTRLPSHRYMSILLDGAREHRLPAPWIASLEAWDLAWDERKGATNPPGVRRG